MTEHTKPHEGGNITRSGEVLFLDAARLEAKARPHRPLRGNRPDGLGLKNWLVRRASALLAGERGAALRAGAFKAIPAMAAAPENSL